MHRVSEVNGFDDVGARASVGPKDDEHGGCSWSGLWLHYRCQLCLVLYSGKLLPQPTVSLPLETQCLCLAQFGATVQCS